MSLGIHRMWKKNLLNLMNSTSKQKLVDVACGTGDIAKLFLENINHSSHITCVDPNKGMIKKGKEKLSEYPNLNWIIASAVLKFFSQTNKCNFIFNLRMINQSIT